MERERTIEILRALWRSKKTGYNENEIRAALDTAIEAMQHPEQKREKTFRERIVTPIPKIQIEVNGQQAIDIIRALAYSASENLERYKHHSTRCMIIAQKVAEEIQKKEMERITGRAAEKDRYF